MTLEEVLDSHEVTSFISSGPDCRCGWFQSVPRDFQGSAKFGAEHAAHVAEAVRAWMADQ